MNRKARATIEEFSMLRQGDTVTAAVSGGADSVALLDFLCSLTDLRLTVRACHLNHCLRGEESDRDEQLVRTMCEQYGIPLDLRRVEVKALARERGVSIEVAAREARYAFFDELAEKYRCKIATAHTLSDAAETVLLNLARGTGIAGLCGIPPVRGAVVRPLIGCTRRETEDYCAAHGLCYVTDSTNLTDRYTRNHIRHNVLPQLFRVNPEALAAVGRMTDSLRRDADCLARLAGEAGEKLRREGGYDAAGLAALHPALRSRIIASLLEEGGVERSAERIGAVAGMLVNSRRHTMQVGPRLYVTVREGVLRLERRGERLAPIAPRQLEKARLDGARIPLDGGKAIEFSVINCADYEIFENIPDKGLKNAADYDKINVDIFLRSRQAGDRMKPAGRGCTKTLKKLFSELGLDGRERLCVLADSEGVFFAEGAGVDERVRVGRGTKNIMMITLAPESGAGDKRAEDE
ncbi:MULTISPECIES: tRNA lysidine(34) synthetase TilS [Anaerotruncus]|nr:tRNA lysidine(34) synthetase TilS [Anaerotruncus massiliensis (ex Togo et al. 2019)]